MGKMAWSRIWRRFLMLSTWSLILLHLGSSSPEPATTSYTSAGERCDSPILWKLLRGGGSAGEDQEAVSPIRPGGKPRASGIRPPTVFSKPSPRFQRSRGALHDDDAMSISGRTSVEQQEWGFSTPRSGMDYQSSDRRDYGQQGDRTPGLYVDMDNSRSLDDGSSSPDNREAKNMKYHRGIHTRQTRDSDIQAAIPHTSRSSPNQPPTPPYIASSRRSRERSPRDEDRRSATSEMDGVDAGAAMTSSRDPTQVCSHRDEEHSSQGFHV
jgi:hypothetical protein